MSSQSRPSFFVETMSIATLMRLLGTLLVATIAIVVLIPKNPHPVGVEGILAGPMVLFFSASVYDKMLGLVALCWLGPLICAVGLRFSAIRVVLAFFGILAWCWIGFVFSVD